MGWRGDNWISTPHPTNWPPMAWPNQLLLRLPTVCAQPLQHAGNPAPAKDRCLHQRSCLPSDRITFVHELGLAGYRTVLAGRMHFKGLDQRHGFHERLVGDIGDTTWGATKAGAGKRQFAHYGAGHAVLEEAAPGAVGCSPTMKR